MKTKSKCLAVLAVLAVNACNVSTDNNKSLDYDALEVNFSATLDGSVWSKDDVIGVYASCSRGGNTTQMSEQSPASFFPTDDGQASSSLVKMTVNDAITALKGDNGFSFMAFMPYDGSNADPEALPADIPAELTYGESPQNLYVAKTVVTGVIAPVKMTFSTPSCLVNLRIPDDIVSESNTVLKKMVLKPASDGSGSEIAYKATFNLETWTTNIVAGSGSKQITMDFGASGLEMESGYTDISFLMAPFTVPEDGFSLEFTDIKGNTNTIPFLNKKIGEKYPSGSVIDQTLSSSSDGIIGCTSPVEWPIGYVDGVGVFSNTSQPLWNPTKLSGSSRDLEHIWTSTQPQATMSYIISAENSGVPVFETNNFSQYNYSAGCVKGSWTGDCFEFSVPVKKFEAGKQVTLTLPTYGRGAPLFWDVEYLDGQTWKCDRTSWTSPDGQFTKNSTLMIEHGNKNGSFEGITYTVKMTFEEAIPSGYLTIRLKVAYGEYITNNSATYATTCKTIDAPITDGSCLFAFVNKSGNSKSIKIEW
ncbi:MAG: fimbrillin family protein [Candidatus Cryptobacteroides sp.]